VKYSSYLVQLQLEMCSTSERKKKNSIDLESRVLLSNYIQLSFGKKKMGQMGTMKLVKNLSKGITGHLTETMAQRHEGRHDSI